jgi:uncharacterized protein YdhG (YjbR/CyaY superfamily)
MRKGGVAPKTIDEYLTNVPEPGRCTLEKIRATIRATVPAEAEEAIAYGMPAFRYKGPLVYFAAFANHCSFFPGNASLIAKFKDDLKGLTTAKGTIRFPLDKPLSATLIKKIVKARVADNDQKQASKLKTK